MTFPYSYWVNANFTTNSGGTIDTCSALGQSTDYCSDFLGIIEVKTTNCRGVYGVYQSSVLFFNNNVNCCTAFFLLDIGDTMLLLESAIYSIFGFCPHDCLLFSFDGHVYQLSIVQKFSNHGIHPQYAYDVIRIS